MATKAKTERTYVWPKGHWSWPIKVTHKHGLRHGQFCFVGGQVDLDPKGKTLHPDDLHAQIGAVMGHIQTVLGQLGADLDDVWETERQLLYVACTRARDHLLVTGVTPGSEFLEDLVAER